MKLKFKFDTQQKQKQKNNNNKVFYIFDLLGHLLHCTLLSDLKCSNISKKEGK